MKVSDKFNSQVLIGCLANISVVISSLFIPDVLLIGITVSLFICTLFGFYLYNYTRHKAAGIHVMLFSYWLAFTGAAFSHIVSYPLILVYPIILGLSNLFFKSRRIKLTYFALCSIGVLIMIINKHYLIHETYYHLELINNILIGLGMLVSFYLTNIIHNDIIESYQSKLEIKEQSLISKNTKLESYIDSNLQLENFAHLASHELKTPIRNIANLTGLINLKLKGKISNNEKDLLDIVNNEVVRMNDLVSNLLELSKVSSTAISIDNIQFPQFINQIISKNFSEFSENIIIKNKPETLFANRRLLEQLFFNLIENALKFIQEGVTPKIVIQHTETTAEHRFEIHDNGIGIDHQNRDQIFLIFKRLHTYGNYEGTGMGLAICKKIVERHEGILSVDSSPVGGSAFIFTIAKSLPEQL